MKPSPKLQGFLKAASYDTKLIPILHEYFQSGRLPDPYVVRLRGGSGDRKPDGWFHPSGHPRMKERQLFFYLTDPDHWQPKVFDFTIKISVLMGSTLHELIRTALEDLGYLIPPREAACPSCGLPQPKKCQEHGAAHPATRSRGHMDGVLSLNGVLYGFEFKSAAPMVIKDIRSNDIEAFKKKWPYYYAQIQEYMRMTGLRAFIVVFWAMGNPWTMKEFTVEADVVLHAKVERTYLAAIAAAETGEMPPMCCNPGTKETKECPALSCPVKRM